jgi:hypothetical protein
MQLSKSIDQLPQPVICHSLHKLKLLEAISRLPIRLISLGPTRRSMPNNLQVNRNSPRQSARDLMDSRGQQKDFFHPSAKQRRRKKVPRQLAA